METRRSRRGRNANTALTSAIRTEGGTGSEADLTKWRSEGLGPLVALALATAFVSLDRPDSATIVANCVPLEEPVGGPNVTGSRTTCSTS